MAINEILPTEASKLTAEGWSLIDVRSPGEYSAVHAQGAINLPLEQLTIEGLRKIGASSKVLLICQSGGRSGRGCEALQNSAEIEVRSVKGGTKAWGSAGLPVVEGKGVISIERQVRIGAGALVLLGALLSMYVNAAFLFVPIFVGAGLMFAGITDFCGMGMLLARMPWNQGAGNQGAGSPGASCKR